MNKRASKQTNKQGDKTNKRGVGMWDALHTMHFEIANGQMNNFFDYHPHHSLKSILRRNPLHSKCITGTDCTSGHPMDLAVPLPCWPGTMKKTVPAIHAPLVSQNHSQDSIASPRVKCLDVCCQVQLDRFGNEQPLIKIWKSELNTYYAFVHRKNHMHVYLYVSICILMYLHLRISKCICFTLCLYVYLFINLCCLCVYLSLISYTYIAYWICICIWNGFCFRYCICICVFYTHVTSLNFPKKNRMSLVYIQAHVNACNPPTSKQYHWIGYKTDNFATNYTYRARTYADIHIMYVHALLHVSLSVVCMYMHTIVPMDQIL
jgi:hypothetical protein